MESQEKRNNRKREFKWHVDEAAQRIRRKIRKIDCATDAPNLVFASTSQADENVFSPEAAGNQCFAMSVVWLMRASEQQQWTERALNAILVTGDDFYNAIISACAIREYFPLNGYLEPGELKYLKPNFEVFGHQWKLDYDDNEVSRKILISLKKF